MLSRIDGLIKNIIFMLETCGRVVGVVYYTWHILLIFVYMYDTRTTEES